MQQQCWYWATVTTVALLLFGALSAQQPVSAQSQQYATVLRLLQQHDYPNAFAACQQLLETAPELEPAYRRFAELAVETGRTTEAEQFFQKLPARTPTTQALQQAGLAWLFSLGDAPDYQRVRQHSRQSLAAAPGLARPYSTLAEAGVALKETAEVKRYLDTALVQNPQNAAAHFGLGCYYKLTNQPQAALAAFDRALALDPALLLTLYEQGQVYLRQKQPLSYQAALAAGKRLLPLAEAAGEAELQIKALRLIGLAQAALGESGPAIRTLETALQRADAAGELPLQDTLLSSLCNHYVARDNYAKGLNACRRALTNRSSRYREYHLLNLGVAYRRIGATDAGLAAYEESLQLSRRKGNTDGLMAVLINLGETYAERGRYTESQELLREAVTLAERLGDQFRKTSALASLGRLYFEQGDYQQAVRAQEEARQLAVTIRKQDQVARSLNSLGLAYAKLGEWQKALTAHQQAAELGAQLNSTRLVWQAQSGLAALQRQRNQPEQALAHYRLALAALEDTRQRLQEEDDKVSFWQDKIRLYKDFIALLLRPPNAAKPGAHATAAAQAEAFHLAEGWRARAFLDALAEAKVNPENSPLSFNQPIQQPEAQKLLDAQTAILSYSLSAGESFLFVLSGSHFAVHRLPGEAVINAQVETLLQVLTQPAQASFAPYRRAAQALYRQLIAPALPQLAGKQQLIIVADGALQRLPFQVLLKESKATSTDPSAWPYLIKEFALSYAPSVSVWANLQAPRRAAPEQKDLLAFGDPPYAGSSNPLSAPLGKQLKPLPYSRREVEKIAALFPRERVALFLGQAACEENVKTAGRLAQYRFVHFAVHASANEAAPRFSGLLFAPSAPHAGEDGLLTAGEIFKLPLNAELVTLSACETGLGKEVKGEGLMSLTRAFIYAGAPSVLMSLWNVDDRATTELMPRFYQYLLQGKEVNGRRIAMNKAQALRQAQLDAIKGGNDPYFWAAFVLAGRQ